MYYSGGVYSGDCASINHAIDAIGYGRDSSTGKDYILVKNSWGTGWGEGGYGKMEAIDRDGGKCEIYKHASYPVIA